MDIILVPGLWLDGASWDEVVPVLEVAGHRTHPQTLPGMESNDADRSRITLRDCIETVVGLVDSLDGPVVLVGHSGGASTVHATVDARPQRVARVVYVDCWPPSDGGSINTSLPTENGEVPLPDWLEFDDADLVDLDDGLRTAFRERAIPSPEHVVRDPVHLTSDRRYDVPITVIACEFTTTQLREWMSEGQLPELAKMRDVTYVDLPTGHWPQFTRPRQLGHAILASIPRPGP